jgi:cupin superfamily acireductone dioxygenase involved in methionine salvage
VIDYYINSEFNLISILNGDWKNISVDRTEVKNQSETIYLSIEDYEISGILKVDKYYNLKDLIINFSDNEFIQLHLNLKGYQSIDFTSIIPDTTGWEVIDFRE